MLGWVGLSILTVELVNDGDVLPDIHIRAGSTVHMTGFRAAVPSFYIQNDTDYWLVWVQVKGKGRAEA